MDDMLDDLIIALSWHGITARKVTFHDGSKPGTKPTTALLWRFSQHDHADWVLTWDGEWQLGVDDPVHGGGDIATIQNIKSPSVLATWLVATVDAITEEATA